MLGCPILSHSIRCICNYTNYTNGTQSLTYNHTAYANGTQCFSLPLQVFRPWLAYTMHQGVVRVKLAKVGRRLANATLYKSVSKWRDVVEDNKRTAAKLRKAAARMMNRAMYQAFASWWEYVVAQKEVKVGAL